MKLHDKFQAVTRKRLGAALALALCSSASMIASAQAETVLRVASYAPERSTFSQSFIKWSEDVTKKTNGELQFKYFWGGALLKPADTAQGVRDGRADIGYVAQVYIPARLPLSTVDSVPFMTSNLRAFGHAFFDTYAASEAMRAEYENNGLHMLLFVPADENLFFSKEPINGVADLKDKRIRAIGLGVPALQEVGANPVAISQPEVFESLNKGLLDATSGATMDLGVDFGFHTAAKYIVDPNYGTYASGTYSINKSVYDSLSPEVREVLDEMSARYLDDYLLPEIQQAVADRCRIALDAGAKIVVWDQAETDKWREAVGDKARQMWLETTAQTGVDAATFLADYEARVREYEKLEWSGAGEACSELAK